MPEAPIAIVAILISLWNLWLWYQSRTPRLEIEAKNGTLLRNPLVYMILTIRNKRPFKTQVVAITASLEGIDGKLFFPGMGGEMELPNPHDSRLLGSQGGSPGVSVERTLQRLNRFLDSLPPQGGARRDSARHDRP